MYLNKHLDTSPYTQMPEFTQNFNRYSYCLNNPLKYVDPSGELIWIPGLDNAGNTIYKAEKGDNYSTFIKQFHTNGKAKEIFKNAKLGMNDGDIKAGTIIKGSAVKEATGSDILKGQWDYLTKNQKAYQIMFGIMHANETGNYDNNGSIKLSDYVTDIYILSSGLSLDNVQIPLKGGSTMPVDKIFIAPSSTLGSDLLIQRFSSSDGNEYVRKDGSKFYKALYYSNKNPDAKYKFTAITLSFPSNYYDAFYKSYK